MGELIVFPVFLPFVEQNTRANLNKSYFSNRQDRYIQFSGVKTLAQYCFDFMKTATKISYKLLPYSDPLSFSHQNQHSYIREDYTLQWPIPDTHPHHFHSLAENAFSSLQHSYRQLLQKSESDIHQSQDVLLIPVIQAGQFNIREEEWATRQLFSHLANCSPVNRPLLDLTSGYFSLYKPYQDCILDSTGIDCRIIAASPKVCILGLSRCSDSLNRNRPMDSSVRKGYLAESQKGILYSSSDL